MQCYYIHVRLLFVVIQEHAKVQGLSSRGHICQHPWGTLGGLWKFHPLHCHSKILETAF